MTTFIPAIYTFVNLTPHDVAIVLPTEEWLRIRPSGTVARVEQSSRFLTRSDDPEGDALGSRTVEIAEPVYGEVQGLPEPHSGVAFIVSQMVAARSPRTDLLYPDSGPDAIREKGQVVAVRRLLRSPPAGQSAAPIRAKLEGREWEAIPCDAAMVVRLVTPLTTAELAASDAEVDRVMACDRGERGQHTEHSGGPSPFVVDGSNHFVMEALRNAGAPLGHAMRSHGDPLQRGVLVLKRET